MIGLNGPDPRQRRLAEAVVATKGRGGLPTYPRPPGRRMATKRLSMLKVREILRHKLKLGLSHRDVAFSVGVRVGVVSKVLARAERAGLDWSAASAADDDALDVRLYGPPLPATATRAAPDCV